MVLNRDFPQLFDELFFNFPTAPKPPMDVSPAYDGKYDSSLLGWTVTMAVAGLSEKDVLVESDGQILYIKGDNSEKEIPDKFKCSFNHKLQIAKELDLTKTKVSLDNGLLTIFIPLAEDKKSKKLLLFGNS